MALIGMAVYSTEENKKDDCLLKTLQSLHHTVDFKKHRLILSVNAFTINTADYIFEYGDIISEVIYNDENIGTAEAINKAWKLRKEGEHCIKMDDDVVIHQNNWVALLEECISRDPNIGIIGLKRKDCWERPYETHEDKHSELIYLPQKPGERCLIVEKCRHIMGTAQLYNSALLDKMGYLFQFGKYGYDDTLASWRSHAGGFKNVFLPHVEIDHIDEGQTPYQSWKEKHAGEHTEAMIKLSNEYIQGKSIYYNPFQ